jgi:hypothetical protein
LKDINEVIKAKQAQQEILSRHIDILREAAKLLAEEERLSNPAPVPTSSPTLPQPVDPSAVPSLAGAAKRWP